MGNSLMMDVLPFLNYSQLEKAAYILGVHRTRLAKGGICVFLSTQSLLHEIRRATSSNFPDRLNRFNEYLEDISLPSACAIEDKYLWEKDTTEPIRLKKKIVDLCEGMSSERLYKILSNWICNPINENCDDYDELDDWCKEFGWSYAEDESGDFVLISPSLLLFKEKINNRLVRLYDAFIGIASYGSGISFPSPSQFDPGVQFLKILIQILKIEGPINE